jgi:hypothetical protein
MAFQTPISPHLFIIHQLVRVAYPAFHCSTLNIKKIMAANMPTAKKSAHNSGSRLSFIMPPRQVGVVVAIIHHPTWAGSCGIYCTALVLIHCCACRLNSWRHIFGTYCRTSRTYSLSLSCLPSYSPNFLHFCPAL